MTHEEIEAALLTTSAVDIDAGEEGPIVLSKPSGRRLAEVVFAQVRSSNVDDLAKNTVFFKALEAAYCKSPDAKEPDTGARDETGEADALQKSRNWRLKKIETQGFGGLNEAFGDVFEFDAAGRDTCIEGQNGSGKSSLANAVLFAMTGKLHRD